MPRFVTMGELLIDFVSSEKGKTIAEAESFIPTPGGAPANVAVGISLLGGDSGFIGKVGDDPFGKRLAEVLEEHGVDTGAISYSQDFRTMLAFVSLKDSGERDFLFFRHPSADMFIFSEDIPENYLDRVHYFHIGSISLITEPSRTTTLNLIKEAKGQGALISFDPNIRPSLWPNETVARDEIMALIPEVDILKLSRDEAFFIARQGDPKEAAKVIQMMGPKLVVVTLGEKGSVAVTSHYGVEVIGYKVDTVDTTGAGDAFTAAMLWMLSEMAIDDLENLGDLDIINITKFANAAGALTTTRSGAIPALPPREEVQSFLKIHRRNPTH